MADIHGSVPQLHDYLEHAARVLGDKVALVRGKDRLTFGAIDRRANHLAHVLVSRGVERGDRVIIFGDNTVDTVVAFWAVLKASAVVSIVNPLTKADKLEYYLKDCRASFLITDEHLRNVWQAPAASSPYLKGTIVGPKDPDLATERDAPPPRRGLDIDLAAIIYTSGSTGDPKGVMLTHRNMLTAATSISAYLQMQEDDVVLGVLPLAFDYGLYQLIMSTRVGARLVLERSFTFPAQVLKAMVDEGVTGFPGVPTIFAVLAELKNLKDYDFSKIRYVTNTAAALPVKHILVLRDLFPAARIYSMYGLTECKRCTYLPPEDIDRKPTSVGIAIPNTELWLVDEDGNKVGPSAVGQLVIRGATVMRGYWEKPEATAKKLKPGPLPGRDGAAHGRLLPPGRGGLPLFRRPDGRHHQVARREGRAQGSRARPLQHPGRPRRRGHRRARRHPRPGREGVRRARVRRFSHREGHPARVPGQAGELHGAEVRRDRAGPADDDDRQDQEDRPEVSEYRVDDLREIDVARSLSSGTPDVPRHRAAVRTGRPGARGPRPSCSGARRIDEGAARPAPAPRVIDVCCGAGNLACAIASHVPDARVWATDLTDGCVGWARRNVEHLGLGDRVTVRQGDFPAGWPAARLEGSIDVIVCNPPYISSRRLAADRAALLEHEPREAFDGGPYGLTIHQRVLKEALPLLKPGGWLLFEIGEGQDRQITLLFQRARAYEAIGLAQNAAGTPRVAFGRVKARPA